MSDLLPVTMVRQWGYCPRVVYYQTHMPGSGRETYKMSEGRAAQDRIETLEMRRGLGEYGWEVGERRFGVWVRSERLGLNGRLDLLLVKDGEAAVVEFKLTSGDPFPNHWLQLGAYGMMVEEMQPVRVRELFVYRIADNRIFRGTLTEGLRARVEETTVALRRMIQEEWFPEATEVRRRCEECEYANYCGDVW